MTNPLLALQQSYHDGTLARNDYWVEMQHAHRMLAAYAPLLQNTGLTIEINAEGLYIVLENGLRFIWNPDDVRTAPNIVINHGAYEESERILVEQIVQECQVMFDIGANIGWYSLHMARLVAARGGHVYAFEPMPTTFDALTRNLALNTCGSAVLPYKIGFGASAGEVDFYIPGFTGSVAASQQPLFPDETNRRITVQLETLDAFCVEQALDRLDFIKCDVEGAELFVLRGGTQVLAEKKPIILLEMLRKWSRVYDYHPNDILRLVADYGYGCWYDAGGKFLELVEMDDACTQTNFFLLHREKHASLVSTLQTCLENNHG